MTRDGLIDRCHRIGQSDEVPKYDVTNQIISTDSKVIGCYSQEYGIETRCYPECRLYGKTELCEKHRELGRCLIITTENLLEMFEFIRKQR
jgi:hypothetical protein